MNHKIAWNADFSVGIDKLDLQHQTLFDIINGIPEEVNEQRARTTIVRLFKYTHEHFAAEEEEMRRMGYPRLEEHAKIHADLVARLAEVSTMPLSTDQANQEFKSFAIDWIVDHIQTIDMDYARFHKTSAPA